MRVFTKLKAPNPSLSAIFRIAIEMASRAAQEVMRLLSSVFSVLRDVQK